MEETDVLLICAVIGMTDLLFVQTSIELLSGMYLVYALLFGMIVATGLITVLTYLHLRRFYE